MKKLRLIVAMASALAFAIALALGGCAGNGNDPPTLGAGSASGPPGMGNGSCATPAQGCPCSTEGVLIQCGEVSSQGPSGPVCAMGVRRCIGGAWSACNTTAGVTPEGPYPSIMAPFHGAPEGGWPLDAGGCSPCDPFCQQTNDVPPDDGGPATAAPEAFYDAHPDGPPTGAILTDLLDAGIDSAGAIYHEIPVGLDGGPTDNLFASLSFPVHSLDLYFLVNSTVAAQPSFDDLAGLMAGDAGVIAQINRDIPGVAYGLGRFTNYESWPYASQSPGNVLFENRQFLTLDPSDTVTTASFTAMKNGTGGACSGGTCFQTTPYVQAQASMTALYLMATNENDVGWLNFGGTASPDWWWNVYSYYGQNAGASQFPYYSPTSCSGELGTLGAPCFRSNAFHIVFLMQSAPAQEGSAGSFPYYQAKPRYFPPTSTADYSTENSWFWWYSPSLGGNVKSAAIAQEPTWTAATTYAVDAIVQPSPPNGFYYTATSISGAGKSGAAHPVWPLTSGGTVIDNPGANQIVWTAAPQYVIDNGAAGNAGDLTLANVGHPQVQFGHVLPNVTAWAASSAVELNTMVVVPGSAGAANPNPNGYYYRALTAGTTGAGPAWPTSAGSTVVDGSATWACMGPTGQAPSWVANRNYALGSLVQPQASPNGYYYRVTTAGTTSNATEPAAFASAVVATACPAAAITDGTVKWTCVGAAPGAAPVAMKAWNGSTAYPIDSIVVPTTQTGFYYIATSGGTSAPTPPGWPLVEGSSVADGTLTWTAIEIGAPPPPWQAAAPVSVGTVLAPQSPSGFYYLVTAAAGATGTSAPATCTTIGQLVTDGFASETCVPAYAFDAWTPGTTYPAGTVVSPSQSLVSGFLGLPNGSLYQVAIPGTSGGVSPSWPAPLASTPATPPSPPGEVGDGSVTWAWVSYNLSNRYQLGGVSTASTTAYGTYDPRVVGGTLIDPSTSSPVPFQQCALGSGAMPITNTSVLPNKVSAGTIATGPDLAWDFTVGPSGQHYWFDTAGTSYDTVLYIVNLANNELMACADDSFWWLSAVNFGVDGNDSDNAGMGPATVSSGTIGFGAFNTALVGWLPPGSYRLVMDKFDNTPVPAPSGTACSPGGTSDNELYSCDGDPGVYELNMWPDITDPGMAGNPRFTAASTMGYSQTIQALSSLGPLASNTYVMGLDLSGVACGDPASSWEDNYTLWSLQNIAHDTNAVVDGGTEVFSVQSNGSAGPATIPVTPVNAATCVGGSDIGSVVSNAVQNFANDLGGAVHVLVNDSDDLVDFDGTYVPGNPGASTAGPDVLTPQNIDDATFVTAVTVGASAGCTGPVSMSSSIVGTTPATPHDTGAGYASCNPGSTPSVTVTFGVPSTVNRLATPQIFRFFVSIEYGQTIVATTPVIIVVPAEAGGYSPSSTVAEFNAAGVCGQNQEVVWGTYYWNQGPPCQQADGGVGNCVPLENPPTMNPAVDSNITFYVAPAYAANQFNDSGLLAYEPDGGLLPVQFAGGLPGELPCPLAVADYVTQTGAVDVNAFLQNPGDAGPIVFGAPPYLQVRAVLTPTADQLQTPVLENYNLTVSCKDSQ